MKKLFTLLLGMLGFGLNTSAQSAYKNMKVADFAQYITSDSVQLVDTRTLEEYEEGHLPKSILINVQDSAFLIQARAKLDKSKPVAVYCRSGKRSAAASALLSKEGFQVTNMLGGILAWIEAEKPIVKE